ncbi:MAG: DMT family transporter [Deltaproteobacteria bacterium]|nr:DMT family transporter [Deltaproteobacteria bacterium]
MNGIGGTRSLNSLKPAIFAMIALSGIWGYNWVVMKECLRYASPFDFAALRTFIGAVSLFTILLLQRKSLIPKEIFMTILLGLLSTTGCIGLVTLALFYGGVGKTAILVYTMPFWVLVLAWPLLSEYLAGVQWIAVILAFSGLMVILEPWNLQSGMLGNTLAVLSGIAWAGSAIMTKIMWKKFTFDLISLTAWQMLFGCIPLIVIAMIVPSPPVQWTSHFIVGLAFSSIVSQALALILWFFILKALSAGMASMGTLATPIIGMIAAAIQLGERPTFAEGMGMILIITGLTILTFQGVIQYRELRRFINK